MFKGLHISNKQEKVRKRYLLLVWLIVATMNISAVNHMDLMSTLTGEFIGSYFGRSVVSLDYNGDGYDDLVVASSLWNPTGVFNEDICYGKIYFYWGGPGFDNVPDFVIEGTYAFQFASASLLSAGNLNNDGYDDLLVRTHGTTYNPNLDSYLGVYFGRTNPTATPDIIWSAPGGVPLGLFALGDINSDEKDDLSIMYSLFHTKRSTYYLYIWDDIFGSPYLIRTTDWSYPCLMGIGDVNGDGFDDCHLSIPVNRDQYSKKLVYFGSQSFPQADTLVLNESILGTDARSAALGDMNGDGYDDFLSYGMNVHLGSPALSVSPSFTLSGPTASWGGSNSGILLMVYGDFNGDGYDDIVASDHRWSYFDGDVVIWLGGQNVNRTYDLRLAHPQVADNFGYSKATGDFNGDGLSDIAVSAPFFWDEGSGHDVTPGKVYIHAGNASLIDTTVSNDDELAPYITNSIRLYPNPISRNEPVAKLILSASGTGRTERITVEMFNLKGQKIKTWDIAADQPSSGVYQIDCKGIATGVYFIRAKHGTDRLGSTKLLIY